MKRIKRLLQRIVLALFKDHIKQIVVDLAKELHYGYIHSKICDILNTKFEYAEMKLKACERNIIDTHSKLRENYSQSTVFARELKEYKFTIDNKSEELIQEILKKHDKKHIDDIVTIIQSPKFIKHLVDEINKYQVKK